MAEISFRSMTPDAYIKTRLDQYAAWYDKKSVKAKRRCLTMRATSVVPGALVPVLVNLEFSYSRPLTTVLSLLVVVLVALESVLHYGEQWKNYRSTEQFLVRERILFLAGEGQYKSLNPDVAYVLLVERCENAIAVENSATLSTLASAPQMSRTGP